jgi:protein SCO1/2
LSSRRVSLLVVAGVVLAAGAARAGGGFEGPTLAHPQQAPGFALRDQNSRLMRLSAQRGHVVLLTFLYTHCPDLCPLTASRLNAVLRIVGNRNVEVLAVSVDPWGDTPAAVRKFVHERQLVPSFHYLTGQPAALRRIWLTYHTSSTATRTTHNRVDHTLFTLLIDQRGRGRVVYDATAQPREIVHDIRLLLGT